MTVILIAFIAMFGAAVGLGLGFGNYSGLKGALIPGLVAGLLISIPALRLHDYSTAVVLVACALFGSIAAVFIPAQNRLKRYCREQKNLFIRCGSYRLGRGRA